MPDINSSTFVFDAPAGFVADGTDPRLTQAFKSLIAEEAPPAPTSIICNLTFCWDGGGEAIVAGDEAPVLWIDFPCRVTGWSIGGKRSETGSASFTVYAGLYADFPVPVSIVAAAPPAVSGAQKAHGLLADVSTWDAELPRGAGLVAVPDTISGFTKMTLSLRVRRLDLQIQPAN